MRANPEEFRALARRFRAEAADAEADLRRLRDGRVYFERWRSPAADEFSSGHHQIALQSTEFPVRDFNELAEAIERAAHSLESAVSDARSIERRTRSWFATQPRPDDGSPPMWEQQWWRYRPGRFPANGDSEWFEVRRYLAGLGVYV